MELLKRGYNPKLKYDIGIDDFVCLKLAIRLLYRVGEGDRRSVNDRMTCKERLSFSIVEET